MIEVTNFIANNKSDNAFEVTNWLENNKTDFFTNIDNTNSIVTCDIIGGGQIIIRPYDDFWNVTLKNNVTTIIGNQSGNQLRKGIKTSKGIVLVTNNNGVIFITKTNTNTIGIVFIKSNDNNTSSDYFFADFMNSSSFIHDSNNLKHLSMSMTSLVSTPLGDSGTYAVGLYYVPFYQYTNTGIISYNGISYWYNQWFAIQE